VEVLGFFYNPNIQPLLEYRRRLTGAREAGDITGVELVEDRAYDPEAWFASVREGEGSRCSRCIGQRLERAAQVAGPRKHTGPRGAGCRMSRDRVLVRGPSPALWRISALEPEMGAIPADVLWLSCI
jgi:hypothetical protein